ncbi:MAG: hypothetical protein BroJett022_05720 [Actinomycetes bacterium]|nr:MAG: hypothetical protein BroJett022_05720 [Actinomycetes bacterium]
MAEPSAPEPPSGPAYGLGDARACVGVRLEAAGGGKVGRVRGVLVDAGDGSPTWLVVKLGRIGRRAAVPARFTAAAPERAWAAFPRSWIRRAAEIDPEAGLTPVEERRLLAHYGIPLEGERGRALADRDPAEPSSIPAA